MIKPEKVSYKMANNPAVLQDINDRQDQTVPVQPTRLQNEPVQTVSAETGGTVNTTLLNRNVFHGTVIINIGAASKYKDGDKSEEATGQSAAASSTAALTGDSGSALATEHQKNSTSLMSTLRQKYERILIGNSKTGHTKFLEDIYTDLIIVQNESGGVIQKHEVMQIEMVSNRHAEENACIKCSDLFKVDPSTSRRDTNVLTMGIAGVGKTVSVNKFILDWAKGEDNQDIKLIFPLPFRELNLKKDKKFSLIELLNYCCFPSNTELKSLPEDDGKVLFIFDGLDECRFPLCFEDGEKVKDINEQTSVSSLITNLINKNLLPFALIWITCRPAAAHLIPREYISLVTEVQGFSDEQKEAYFSKYCKEDLAVKIVAHIKKSRSLHIMCQIPVFCWISAAVLQQLMDKDSNKEIPTTLTGMYINFLLQQKKIMEKKYSEKTETVNAEDVILKLGELAFCNLECGTLIFYEDDLRKCGIDVSDGTVFSGVCTQLFSQQEGVSERNIFSFVHLSVQESLAALYVHHRYCNKNENALQKDTSLSELKWRKETIRDLHECAVNRALQSENGHLDLFLRFLIGLALEDSQHVLTELLPNLKIKAESLRGTAVYIKMRLEEKMSSDRSVNLFHCLNEMKDNSLTTEIQQYMNSGDLLTQQLSSAQWSALVFVLLMSEDTQEKFQLKKYRRSEKGLKRLMPVVKNTRQALLDLCNLGVKTCEDLGSVLNMETSSLQELDLSNNDMQDSGVQLLSAGLKSSHCKLKILRLSGCMITEEGCSSLASALSSNPSHMKELDLTYNHLGESGVKLLSARLEDPQCSLNTLRVEHGGENRIKPGLKKYYCEFTLDPNTVNRYLSLSDGNRKVKFVNMWDGQPYPDHPERFDYCKQVLSRESVTGRCYWEAEWSGADVEIAVTYKSISRKGNSTDCQFGKNEKSWILYRSNKRYLVHHNNISTALSIYHSRCNRVGVYVDCPAGTLSFYRVSSDPHTQTHLHTFYTSFTELLHTETLHAGFRVYHPNSSVCLI